MRGMTRVRDADTSLMDICSITQKEIFTYLNLMKLHYIPYNPTMPANPRFPITYQVESLQKARQSTVAITS